MKNSLFGKPVKAHRFACGGYDLYQRFLNSKAETERDGLYFIEAMRLWLIYFGERKVLRYLERSHLTPEQRINGEEPKAAKRGKAKRILQEKKGKGSTIPTNAERVAGISDRCRLEIKLLYAHIAYHEGRYLTAYRRATNINDDWRDNIKNEKGKKKATGNVLLTRVNIVAGKALNKDRDHGLARVHFGLAHRRTEKKQRGEAGQADELKKHYARGRIQSVFARSIMDWNSGHGEIGKYLRKAFDSYDAYFGSNESTRDQLFYAEVHELAAREMITKGKKGTREAYQRKIAEGDALFEWEATATTSLNIATDIIEKTLAGCGRPVCPHCSSKGKRNSHRRLAHVNHLRARMKLTAASTLFHSGGKRADRELDGRLRAAERFFKEELKIRRRYFNHGNHPSRAKAHNFLCRVYLLRAECASLRQREALVTGDHRAAGRYRLIARRLIVKAETSLRMARKTNRKGGKTSKESRVFEGSLEEDEFSNQLMNEKLRYVTNDFQAFRSEVRKLQCQVFRYRFSELTGDSRRALFRRIRGTYNRAEVLLEENIRWHSYEESQQELREKFTTAQGLMLGVCDLHLKDYPTIRRMVERQIHRVFMHSPVKPANEAAWQPSTEGLKGKMRAVQTANYWRLISKPQTPETEEEREKEGKARETWRVYAEDLIGHHRERIRAEGLSRKGLKIPNTGGRRKRILSTEERIAATDARRNPEAFIARFEKSSPRGAFSVFMNNGFIFFYGLFNSEEPEKRVCFRCVEKASLTGAASGLYGAISDFREVLDHIIELAEGEHKKQNLRFLMRKASFRTGHLPPDPSVLLSGSHSRLLKEKEADALNELFMRRGYHLFQLLFPADFIPEGLNALYFIPNHDDLRFIPIGMLPMSPIEPREDATVWHRDLPYVGTTYEVAYMPSLHHLYLIGDQEHGPPKKNRRLTSPRANELAEALIAEERPLILGIRPLSGQWTGGQYRGGIVREGRKAMATLMELMDALPGKLSRSYAITPVGKADPEYTKAWILEQSEKAAIFYFFGHINTEQRKYGARKLMIRDVKEVVDADRPWWEAMERSEDSIYNEEISDRNHLRNYLIFLNGCSAFLGSSRAGFLPHSMVAASLEAGTQAVIATNTKINTTSAEVFGSKLFHFWLNDSVEGRTDLGASIRLAARKMLEGRKSDAEHVFDHCAHPIHWGSYFLMGDLTLKMTNILNELYAEKCKKRT